MSEAIRGIPVFKVVTNQIERYKISDKQGLKQAFINALDIKKKFIWTEVISYDNLIEAVTCLTNQPIFNLVN